MPVKRALVLSGIVVLACLTRSAGARAAGNDPIDDRVRGGIVLVEQHGEPIAIGTGLGRDGRVLTALSLGAGRRSRRGRSLRGWIDRSRPGRAQRQVLRSRAAGPAVPGVDGRSRCERHRSARRRAPCDAALARRAARRDAGGRARRRRGSRREGAANGPHAGRQRQGDGHGGRSTARRRWPRRRRPRACVAKGDPDFRSCVRVRVHDARRL